MTPGVSVIAVPLCVLLMFCPGLYAENNTCAPLPYAYVMNSKQPFLVVYEFPQIDFNWESLTKREAAVMSESFIQKNVIPSDVKIWKDRMYITTPRYKPGVTVTLGTLQKIRILPHAPNIQAFPDWKMQKIGNCKAFQSVTGIEIDNNGLLWAVDSGIINSYTERPEPKCPPKLVVIDLNSVKTFGCNRPSSSSGENTQSLFGFGVRKCPENNFKLVHTYEFPQTVVNPMTNYLGKIVLDTIDGTHAYIVDSGETPGIVAYCYDRDISWKVTDEASMHPRPNRRIVTVDTVDFPLDGWNIHGIALSPITDKERFIYYSNLGSCNLYKLPVNALKYQKPDATSYITNLGKKQSISDGLYCDARGSLYFGLQGCNTVATWNPAWGSLANRQKQIQHSDTQLVWPDGFGIDDDLGHLYVITNRKANYIYGKVDMKKKDNWRVMRAELGTQSYKKPYDSDIKGAIDYEPQVYIN